MVAQDRFAPHLRLCDYAVPTTDRKMEQASPASFRRHSVPVRNACPSGSTSSMRWYDRTM